MLQNMLALDHAAFSSKHLKRLGLCNVRLSAGFFRQIETGCSALEFLYLNNCIIVDFKISSQTLKDLTMIDTEFHYVDLTSISAPSLILLCLWDNTGRGPSIKNMASLVLASFLLRDGEDRFHVNESRQLLRSLAGVKNLKLVSEKKELELERDL